MDCHDTGFAMLAQVDSGAACERRPGTAMLDLVVTIGGIVYGMVLVCVAFLRNRYTEALRIDALMVPKPTDATRMINPVIGVLLIAYNTYSLLA